MIRMALEDDLEDMAKLWLEAHAERGELPCDIDAWVRTSKNLMDAGVYQGFVVQIGAAIAGFIDGVVGYEPDRSRRQLIGRHVWVAKEYRDQGWGEKLYLAMVEAAVARGATEVVTTGEMSARMHEKLFGAPMKPYHQLWIGGLECQ